MDTKVVEVNKNIFIYSHNTDGSQTTFTANIDTVNFIPDVVIVRMITFNSAESSTDPYLRVFGIYSNLIDDNWIGSITDVGSVYPNTTFILKKPVKGTYTFITQFGINAQTVFVGDIAIHLEFIKYKEVKEGKVY